MPQEVLNMIEKTENKWKRLLEDVLDIVSFIVFLVWVLLFVRLFLFSPFTVKWQSMEPSFSENNFIVVDKIFYKYKWIKRWDVIVFVPQTSNIPFIKRIVWMPWETVQIKDWEVHVCNQWINLNCEKIDESYIKTWLETKATCKIEEFKIPKDGFLIFWDNRWHSTDSRCCFKWYCSWTWDTYWITKDEIIWKVYMEIMPEFKMY